MATSFVQMFNQLKIIHCMCPKCDNIMRVSDLQIRSKDKVEKTWLDVYESKEKSIDAESSGFYGGYLPYKQEN